MSRFREVMGVREEGNTYVFKSDEHKEEYIRDNKINTDILSYIYGEGYFIEYIGKEGYGYAVNKNSTTLISPSEFKYFKIKEERF